MKNLHKKKVSVLGKQIPVLLIAIVAVMGIGTAALLPYFGQITGMATVSQGLLVDGESMDESASLKTSWDGDEFTSLQAMTFVSAHSLDNNAGVDAEVDLDTEKSADRSPNSVDEMKVGYYESGVYQETITIDEYSIPATIEVEDLGDKVKWTIDMDESDEDFANGHGAYGLVISHDGDKPAYQIHSNDGTCTSEWAEGTHLYSEYYDDSWHTGGSDCASTNTEVSTMDSINASGERDLSSNTDAVYEIVISKDKIGQEEFYWGVALMGDTSDTQYPNAWTKWSGDASGLDEVSLLEELTNPVTVPAGETVDFAIVTDFPEMTYPGEYTVTTTVNPAE